MAGRDELRVVVIAGRLEGQRHRPQVPKDLHYGQDLPAQPLEDHHVIRT